MSVDGLMAKARALAGVDLIDHEVVEPLSILHRSLCEESNLHALGLIAKEEKLLRLLANRLRMRRDFERYPQIADEKIEEPLFIIGMARSGTTKTQKVLSISGDFNWLPFWQAYNPALLSGSRTESVDARIADADAYCLWFDDASPETKLGHAFVAREPEEDTTLTEQCFRAVSFQGYADVPSYTQWLATQSPLPLFEFLRDAMKYLQWQGLASGNKKWLLKSPTYYGSEAALLRIFPDAQFVMTHRSPLQTVPSACKLIECFRRPFGNAPVDAAALTIGFGMLMDLHIANRRALSQLRILDLSFDDINCSIEAIVERIYEHCSMRLTDEVRQRVCKWTRDNPMHRLGRFNYSLEQYGLSAEQVNKAMAGYLELIDQLFATQKHRAAEEGRNSANPHIVEHADEQCQTRIF